jgi:hypothetical protein
VTGHRHAGIPCVIVGSTSTCRAIAIVLRQIKRRAPRDFQRVLSLVNAFEPLPAAESEEVSGRWGSSRSDLYDFEAKGAIQIRPGVPDAIPLVAHELGHACTREADFERLDGFDSEWASEMCADRYAYKWGFGRVIARHRPNRDLGHHGPGPRSVFTVGPMEVPDWPGRLLVHRYRVTRTFRIRFVQSETPEGVVIETAIQADDRRRREFEERVRQHKQ